MVSGIRKTKANAPGQKPISEKAKEPPNQFTGVFTRCYHQKAECTEQLGGRQGIITRSMWFERASTTAGPAHGRINTLLLRVFLVTLLFLTCSPPGLIGSAWTATGLAATEIFEFFDHLTESFFDVVHAS